ncbi:MAG: Kef-type transport system, predicted NAD-binding component [Deltaproteobacteria bacterium]|nr:Kef-type transport system, predicted NAD-binding component [Deltaproteobacteria bacterium]
MDLHLVLRDLAVVLAVAIAVALLFGRLKLSVVAAFLVGGAVMGPTGAGLVSETSMVSALAEIGVALLLFTVGLEISFSNLGKMRRRILLGGGGQLAATTVAVLLSLRAAGFDIPQAVFIGFVLSLSSTAIVMKVYSERMELESSHGRISVGILLFQDMAVIPMMLLIPSLRDWETARFASVAFTLLKAGAGVAGILLLATFAIPRLLKEVIRLNSREILAMAVLCIILGTAYIAQMWGLSLAMGAFLAGLVVTESDYIHEIAAQIFPFRDVFNGVFFISVGMLLDLPFLSRNFPVILLLSALVLAGKAVCAGASIRGLRYPWAATVVAAVGLAQVGEFSFVLLFQGFRDGLVDARVYQHLLAIAILTMVATPFLMSAAPGIARFWVRRVVHGPDEGIGQEETLPGQPRENHVIIAGYGMNGRNLAKVLRSTRLPYVVVDLNDVLVRQCREEGETIFYGDVNNPEVLDHLGISRARMMVLAISDPMATRRAVAAARRSSAGLFILVRTRYVADVDDLISLGANAVIPEEFETSVEIFSRVLQEYHVPDHIVRQQEALIRSGTYRILRERTTPRGGAMMTEFEEFLRQKVIEIFYVSPETGWAGRTVEELPTGGEPGVTLLAILRGEQALVRPPPMMTLCAGDKLVLFGGHAPLATALGRMSRAGG